MINVDSIDIIEIKINYIF